MFIKQKITYRATTRPGLIDAACFI